jgi:hypothetical protein
MIDIILSVLPLVLIALTIYCAGALLGWWTVFGVPVSMRP